MKAILKYLLFVVLGCALGCTSDDIPSDCMGEPKEIACYQIYDPVCGCNGVTYSNSCSAMAAGVKSSTPGECNKK